VRLQHGGRVCGDEVAVADDEADPGVLGQWQVADGNVGGGGLRGDDESVQVLGFFLEADTQAQGSGSMVRSGIFSRGASAATPPPCTMTENATTTKIIS
jgi:hypothetical protein